MSQDPISQDKQKKLSLRLRNLGIYLKDLKEHFVRSSGPGGQKVNKTSSCVVLRHIPTGIEVKCQQARTQVMNRFLAKRLLAERFEALILKKKTEEQKKREKIRRQKRKRSKRAQEKRLQEKKGVSEKKKMRKKVSTSD